MKTQLHHARLLASTVRYLSPSQIAHRVRLRTQLALVRRFGRIVESLVSRSVESLPGWPLEFEPLDLTLPPCTPTAEENARGMFCLINQSRALGDPPDWVQASASRLWRYHLHYLDWAWGFAAHLDNEWARGEFARLWRSWRAASGLGSLNALDAWSPYAASLRAWTMCGVFGRLIAGTPLEVDFIRSIALHAWFVRAHLELDVGGNHLIKNLKALAGLGVFLGDDRLIDIAIRHLKRELDVQVLSDGGHFERSPSYHCQVLGDLIEVRSVLGGRRCIDGLDDAIEAMRAWLGEMLMPDGDVPLFNDCTLVGRKRLRLLEPSPRPAASLRVLASSGYVVVKPSERLHLVLDVGPPCPPSLPAHAHADCLSFELAVDGRRVIVDSGTSTYEPGAVRDNERSTRAHNTAEVDGQNQTEVWGTFRAARRAMPTLESANTRDGVVEVVASHDGYRRLEGSPIHRRSVLASANEIQITDELDGDELHEMVVRAHLAPNAESRESGTELALGDVRMRLIASPPGTVAPVRVARGFNVAQDSTALAFRVKGRRPRVSVSILLAAKPPGAR